MKKVIFALVLGFSLSDVTHACTHRRNCKVETPTPAQMKNLVAGRGCSNRRCKTETPTPAQMKNLVARGCNNRRCKTETPVVPSLKDAKMVACEDGNCKTQPTVPPVVAECQSVPCKTQPANPPVIACDTRNCRLHEETPVVPSLKDAMLVAGCDGSGCI